MKRMNFIDKIAAHKHLQLQRWFLFSSVALCAAAISIVLFQSMELYELYSTHTQLTSMQEQLKALELNCEIKTALQQKKSSLTQVKTHITGCTTAPCNPHDTLCMLTKLTALPISLQSVQLHQDGIELTAQTNNLQYATHAIEQLKRESPFAQLELTSITHGQKGLMVRIKGKK